MDTTSLDHQIRRLEKQLQALRASTPAHESTGAHQMRVFMLEEELEDLKEARDRHAHSLPAAPRPSQERTDEP